MEFEIEGIFCNGFVNRYIEPPSWKSRVELQFMKVLFSVMVSCVRISSFALHFFNTSLFILRGTYENQHVYFSMTTYTITVLFYGSLMQNLILLMFTHIWPLPSPFLRWACEPLSQASKLHLEERMKAKRKLRRCYITTQEQIMHIQTGSITNVLVYASLPLLYARRWICEMKLLYHTIMEPVENFLHYMILDLKRFEFEMRIRR